MSPDWSRVLFLEIVLFSFPYFEHKNNRLNRVFCFFMELNIDYYPF